MKIKGKQIYLRYPALDDADEFTRLNRANRKFHHRLASPPKEAQSFSEFVERNQKPENEFFLICRKRDGAIAGAINLSQIFRAGFQNAYLGYYLGEEFAGNGFVTEAVGLVLRYAFRDLKLNRIEANIQPHNLASIAVVRKNGFSKEGYSPKYLKIGGRWRDHERWAITRHSWVRKK